MRTDEHAGRAPASTRRQRLRAWLRRLTVALLILLAVPTALVLWWATRTPTVARDFYAELNEPLLLMAPEDRAWPEYRRIKLALPLEPEEFNKRNGAKIVVDVRPGDPEWGILSAYLIEAAPQLAMLRAAAGRPNLGRALTNADDPDLAADSFRRMRETPSSELGSEHVAGAPLTEVSLQHIGTMRGLLRLLRADCRLAATQGDAERAAANLRAIRGLADHGGQTGGLLGFIFSSAAKVILAELVLEVLYSHPALLNTEQLRQVRTLVESGGFEDQRLASLGFERAYMLDALQRLYTDDGQGNGIATRQGVEWCLLQAQDASKPLSPTGLWLRTLGFGFGAVLIGPDRKTQLARYDAIVASSLADEKLPVWTYAGESATTTRLRDFADMPPIRRFFYAPTAFLVPSTRSSYVITAKWTMLAQAAQAMIDVHVFHQSTGRWPGSLEEVPGSSRPIDMFTGQPLVYRLGPTGPTLYSVGSNRVDDGGVAPASGLNPGEFITPNRLRVHPQTSRDPKAWGDYVLYPPASDVQ